MPLAMSTTFTSVVRFRETRGGPQPVFAHHSQAAFVRMVTCTRKPPRTVRSACIAPGGDRSVLPGVEVVRRPTWRTSPHNAGYRWERR